MSVEAMWEDYLKSIGELIVESEKTYEAWHLYIKHSFYIILMGR